MYMQAVVSILNVCMNVRGVALILSLTAALRINGSANPAVKLNGSSNPVLN